MNFSQMLEALFAGWNRAVTWCDANEGFGLIVLTLIYAITTLWLAATTERQLRATQKIEKQRTRPFPIFDLIIEKHTVFAVIRNIGVTAAWDIKFVIEPQIFALLGGENAFPRQEQEKEIAFLKNGIGQLAPNREIKAYVGFYGRFAARYPDLTFSGILKFKSSDGTSYTEEVLVDLKAQSGILSLGKKTTEDVAAALERISKTLEHIARRDVP